MTFRNVAFCVFALAVPLPRLAAQSPADSSAIILTALNYLEGWYEGSAERMEEALHPALVKRIVNTDLVSRESTLEEMSAEQLIRMTGSRGSGAFQADMKDRIEILDIFNSAAVVRADADAWVDYLQIAKFDGRWVIINVLWEMRR